MGIYDILPEGSQVKLWDSEEGVTRRVGDTVPSFGVDKYVVLLREGGYVLVEGGIITEIRENTKINYYPEDFPDQTCLDKWGCEVGSRHDLVGQFQGIMGMEDPYYWSK